MQLIKTIRLILGVTCNKQYYICVSSVVFVKVWRWTL